MQKKYQEEQTTMGNISSALNSENSLVAKQAYEVINLIHTYVEPTEYFTVGFALQNSYLFDMAAKMYKAGIDMVTDMNDEVALRRGYANLNFIVGNPEGGRAQYQDTLKVFEKYPSSNSYIIESVHLMTELQWTYLEASIRQCEFAKEHLASAAKHLSSIPLNGGPSQYGSQFNGAKQVVDNCIQ
jgi:hypothetical protein